MVDIGKVFVIIKVAVDTAVASYADRTVWILTAIFIGWAFHVERDIKVAIAAEPIDDRRTISILPY
jgi:hypothetical protein